MSVIYNANQCSRSFEQYFQCASVIRCDAGPPPVQTLHAVLQCLHLSKLLKLVVIQDTGQQKFSTPLLRSIEGNLLSR